MGVVFTWREVRDGHVPQLEDFVRVRQMIQSGLKNNPYIVAGIICGSVLRDDHNVRSDVDCALLYRGGGYEVEALKRMQEIVVEAQKLCVPINFIPVDTATAASGMHHFGPSFLKHLAVSAANGGAIKEDFLAHLAPAISMRDEVTSYLRSKLYNLTEGAASFASYSDERKAAFLKKVLESPMHIARKVLDMYGCLDGDSKREVVEAYCSFASEEMSHRFGELCDADFLYNIKLAHQLKKKNKEGYTRCLNALVGNIQPAIHFARLNALLLDEPLS